MTDKQLNNINKLIEATQKFLAGIKNQDDGFDYSRFIKKVFYSLREESPLELLKTKNKNLFMMRDNNEKIITIIPGIDIRLALTYMSDDDINKFWSNFYLFTSSAFSIICKTNIGKEDTFKHINETIKFLDKEIQTTGILIGSDIFNPFVGLQNNDGDREVTMNELFSHGPSELPNSVSGMESMLGTLGVDKLLDPSKLKEQLADIGDEQVCEATDKIVEMLGAQENDDVKEVCGTLIKDIVDNLKQNGLTNIGGTLMDIANQTKQKVNADKMRQTAISMQKFMNNSSDILNNIKDETGNGFSMDKLSSMISTIQTSCQKESQ